MCVAPGFFVFVGIAVAGYYAVTAFSQQLELVIVFQGAENGPRHILQRQKELRDFYTSVSLPSSRPICCQTLFSSSL